MTVGLARKIADSYLEHVVGANEVTPQHKFKNDGECFLREFFEYSPINFSEEEKDLLMEEREGGPSQVFPGSCEYIVAALAVRSGVDIIEPTEENPLGRLVQNLHFLNYYQGHEERKYLL
jgi:hypothetical protein